MSTPVAWATGQSACDWQTPCCCRRLPCEADREAAVQPVVSKNAPRFAPSAYGSRSDRVGEKAWSFRRVQPRRYRYRRGPACDANSGRLLACLAGDDLLGRSAAFFRPRVQRGGVSDRRAQASAGNLISDGFTAIRMTRWQSRSRRGNPPNRAIVCQVPKDGTFVDIARRAARLRGVAAASAGSKHTRFLSGTGN